ncbi:hypothetical protein TELCIR_25698, partial [Teladorsagia circumcincta]
LIPENYQALTPILKTPISDLFAIPLSQQGRPCGFFEAQFFRCMEAYGAKLGRKYCDLEHRDFRECLTHEKQKKVSILFSIPLSFCCEILSCDRIRDVFGMHRMLFHRTTS